MKRMIALCALLTVLLASCGSGAVAMSCGNTKITENQYKYFVTKYKAVFARQYSDYSDTSAFWQSTMNDGTTAEAFLTETVVCNVKMTVACAEEFDRLGGKLSDSATEKIDSLIAEYKSEYADGSTSALNSQLAEFGVNTRTLREVMVLESKSAALYELLYGDGGLYAPTDAERDEYVAENYVRILHIYVNDKFAYETDSKRYIKTDSNGNYVKRSLTDAEIAEKEAKKSAIEAMLAEGKFAEAYTAYSEDRGYDNGYYIYTGMSFITEVVNAAFATEIGDFTVVSTDYGTHYVVRIEAEEKPYTNEANDDFFNRLDTAMTKEAFIKYASTIAENVVVDEEIISKYRLSEVTANTDF